MSSRTAFVSVLSTATLLGLTACGGAETAAVDIDTSTPTGAAQAYYQQGLDARNPRVVWDMMPASYHADVNGLIKDFSSTIDPEMYNGAMGVAKKAVQLLRDKKDVLLANPMLAQMPVDKKVVETSWDSLVGMLDTVTSSELSSLDSLKGIDVGAFLQKTGGKLLEQSIEVAKLMPEGETIPSYANASFKALSSDDNSAEVEITTGDQKQTDKLMKVEGKWVPAEMVTDWKSNMTAAKGWIDETLGSMTPEVKADINAKIKQVDGVVGKLLEAKSADEFNMALGAAMMQLMR